MIVTIDGPAGAGKSTVARELADRLHFEYLDTGAMYRAIALAGLRAQVDWDRPGQLADLARTIDIRIVARRTLLDCPQLGMNGEDVTEQVRSLKVTSHTRYAANNPAIREIMVRLQRQFADEQGDIVTEGRDQGSAVFPDAECKIFLTATPEERARRRMCDLEAQGESADMAKLLADIIERDRSDSARSVGPLIEPPDAVRVVTDGMTAEQVIEHLVAIVNERR